MREGEEVDRGASRYLICHISVTPAHTHMHTQAKVFIGTRN